MKSSMGTQRGQVIILFILALVGLLAFAGLAVDAAMIYSDRRAAQTAADSAALAGAGAGGNTMQLRDIYNVRDFVCADLNIAGSKMNRVKKDILEAAISRANINGYLIDSNFSDNHGVEIACSDGQEKYLDIEVRITTQTQSSFLHLVFNKPLVNTVTGVARLYPPEPLGGGSGIIALNKTMCKQGGQYVGGIYLDGTTIDVTSDGGGMSSNTCIIRNGNTEVTVLNSNPAAFARTSSDWTNDAVFVDGNGNPLTLKQTSDYQLTIGINPPNCSGLPTINHPNYSSNLNPGIYPNGITHNATLNPGLYCIDQPNNGKIGNLTSATEPSGEGYNPGVTLYIRTGSISMSSSTDFLKLYAPSKLNPDPSPAKKGLVLYIANGDFVMTGGSTADLAGTIYVPNGTIDLGGASTSNTWKSVLIANNVKIHGNPFASLLIDFNQVVVEPASLSMLR